MRIRLVLSRQNAGWVIGKMAQRLGEALCELGHDATVSQDPDPLAAINHWMSFAFADGAGAGINTMFITHPDDPYKVRLIGNSLRSDIHLGICMSRATVEALEAHGIPSEKLWYSLPALDSQVTPRRRRIGITTRLYADGRKRERFLVRLANDMRLDDFHFQIFGLGWDAVVERLRSAGAVVDYDPGSEDWMGDYSRITSAIPQFDFYLYLGMDEGSLGTLDAVSAGVRTIVTAQGFHLEVPGGIDHPFVDYEELRSIFQKISTQRAETRSRLDSWTWQSYAREHVAIWELLLKHAPADVPRSEMQAIARGSPVQCVEFPVRKSSRMEFLLRSLSPRRLAGAAARARWLRPVRRRFGF